MIARFGCSVASAAARAGLRAAAALRRRLTPGFPEAHTRPGIPSILTGAGNRPQPCRAASVPRARAVPAAIAVHATPGSFEQGGEGCSQGSRSQPYCPARRTTCSASRETPSCRLQAAEGIQGPLPAARSQDGQGHDDYPLGDAGRHERGEVSGFYQQQVAKVKDVLAARPCGRSTRSASRRRLKSRRLRRGIAGAGAKRDAGREGGVRSGGRTPSFMAETRRIPWPARASPGAGSARWPASPGGQPLIRCIMPPASSHHPRRPHP